VLDHSNSIFDYRFSVQEPAGRSLVAQSSSENGLTDSLDNLRPTIAENGNSAMRPDGPLEGSRLVTNHSRWFLYRRDNTPEPEEEIVWVRMASFVRGNLNTISLPREAITRDPAVANLAARLGGIETAADE
jgi:hypothetical protein